MSLRALVAAVVSLALPGSAMAESSASDAVLRSAVQAAAKEINAGAVVAVRGCGMEFTESAGLAERTRRAPMPVDAPLRVGSVGKVPVAAVVLSLVAEGKLRLDAPIANYLGDEVFRGIAGREATIAQLLNHTGGVPDYYTPTTIKSWDWRQPLTPARVLAAVRGLPATHKPGATYAYSNTGYHLLALAAEAASGEPLETLLSKRVFEPVGMTSARYLTTPPGGPIHGYGLPKRPNADTWAFSENTGPDSGMTASAQDVQSLLSALFLPNGVLNTSGRLMMSALVPTGRERRASGLGVEVVTGRDGLVLVGHTGEVAGYLTFAFAAQTLNSTLVGHINADRPEVLVKLLRASVAALQAQCAATPIAS